MTRLEAERVAVMVESQHDRRDERRRKSLRHHGRKATRRAKVGAS